MSDPGPWFIARFEGECSAEGDTIEEGDEIRADGSGGYEHRDCVFEYEDDDWMIDPFD